MTTQPLLSLAPRVPPACEATVSALAHHVAEDGVRQDVRSARVGKLSALALSLPGVTFFPPSNSHKRG